ncbi:probable polygalacturonase At1g80170 [Telopea speciosissima]|uniref:probable polygalacturonase At1g80170 n=1 Tax=Telopea speciosissima TaxID=54955 RepID=UPI001CC5E081|nr:probable polygalacturonase At1g80170 [Telopea speciosissima]
MEVSMFSIVIIFFLFGTTHLASVQPRLLLDRQSQQGDNHVFNLLNHGAVGDGITDDTQAFQDAWNQVCNSSLPYPTLQVPSDKTFLLHPVVLEGPCISNNVTIEVLGNMLAPSDTSEWQCDYQEGTYNCPSWLTFEHVNNLYINGGEGNFTIDGQGHNWWDLSCHKTMLILRHCSNVHISNINIVNGPNMHIFIQASTWIYTSNVNIFAPKTSPNTDGIHIQYSQNVFVHDSNIGTGDDCISIGESSSYINISRISCGPGHGISIGSLGRGGKIVMVEYIHVSDVEFSGTSNGVRIKTWQTISAVEISNVTYNHIYGTSDRPIAIKFDCSDAVPCRDIFVNDINIPKTKKGEKTSAYCRNAYGRSQDQVVPGIPCLKYIYN